MNMEAESQQVLNEYLKIATSFSIPIFWGKRRGSTWKILNNGTAFILDTGADKFVVTAAHVYRSYLKAKGAGQTDESQLSNIGFEMESRLISIPQNNDIDIATFKISDPEISRLGKNVLRGGNLTWPPSKPNEGEAIIVSGFPGAERQHRIGHAFSFGTYCFNTPVSSVSSRHIGCSLERKYWRDTFGRGFPPENYDMGGVSGAPALALEKSEAGIISLQLAGIVYEARASELIGEIFFAHHSEFIDKNGVVAQNA
ncbi:hypothetical protein [uncultured Microbulbifer sp.]|uniref:hypothetical protein n=1 Tax=uncultured Microbulbifer sp. TaxID=348147 RepID=UPI0026058772|nr:hypothetical protein [uncultured Microbulbifer sp.]